MGYDTNFVLKLHNAKYEDRETIFREVEKVSKYTLNEIDTDKCEARLNDAHWYYCSDDLKKVSKKYPEVIFELYGEGEDHNDTWKGRYQDGKEEFIRAETTWQKFEEILTEEEKNKQKPQKTVRLIYQTDAWHSRSSMNLMAISDNPDTFDELVIKVLKELNIKKEDYKEALDQISRYNQTQFLNENYDLEIHVETVEGNTIL